MRQIEKEALLRDVESGIALLESTKRPTPPTIERAVTLFRKVELACQTITITPVDEFGTPIETPPPGSEQPPIIPVPPEIPPGGGGGGGGNEPPPQTTITTTYNSVSDFSTVQGFRQWYYLEQDGTQMTYTTTNARWQGRQSFQSIWNLGQHPGASSGAMRRWVSPSAGTIAVSGAVSDQSAGGSTGVTFRILKNGSSLYSQDMPDGGSLSPSVTGSVIAGDTIDFLVFDSLGDIGQDGTLVNMTVSLTTQGTGGTPTQTTLPFLLNGTAPQDAILTLNMNKPGNANGCTLAITGVNLDADYGLLYFNGTSNRVTLWPTAPANSGISATVDLPVPVAYVTNGQNTLRFTHASGAGYTVTAVSPSFTTVNPPTPPATQTTLPFILNGNVLPEDGLLTINISKPANPTTTCTVSVTGTDLAEADGTLSINGNTASTIWPVNAANDGAVRTVNLTVNSSLFNNGVNTLRFTHTTGDGFIISAVSVTIPSQPDQPPPQGGAWPNEPSTHTLKTDWGFSLPFASGWIDAYNGASLMTLVTSQNGPQSPPGAVQCRFPVGHPGGNGVGNFEYTGAATRETYLGFWLKIQSPFQNHTAPGNKIQYFMDQSAQVRPFFSIVIGTGSVLSMNLFGQGGSNIDNTHLSGVAFPGSWNMYGSVSNVVVGQWNRCEFLLRKSTTLTSRDGICRWWVNGTLVGDYTNVNTDQAGFIGTEINPVFGGTGQVKTQEDYMWFDHIRITGGS